MGSVFIFYLNPPNRPVLIQAHPLHTQTDDAPHLSLPPATLVSSPTAAVAAAAALAARRIHISALHRALVTSNPAPRLLHCRADWTGDL
jgi:hypothetical protein